MVEIKNSIGKISKILKAIKRKILKYKFENIV